MVSFNDSNGISYNIVQNTTLPYTAEVGSNYTYSGNATVIIPNIVTDASNSANNYYVVGIAPSAFYKSSNNTGNSVIRTFDASACSLFTYINASAFRRSALTSIYFPSSLTIIGEYAFYYSSLQTIILPSTFILDFIGQYAFSGCRIQNFTFPSSLTNLSRYAFEACNSLTSLDLSACTNLTSISDGVFSSCGAATTCILPPNLISINGFTFYYSKFTSIIIPASVNSIGYQGFYYSLNLRSVTFNGTTIPTLGISSFSYIGSNSTAYYQYGTSQADITRLKNYGFFTNYVEVNTPIPIICFKENTKILTNNGYRPIQELKKGDLVKTLRDGFKPITMIGKRDVYHPASKERIKDQLYKCSQSEYPEIFEPLIITGCHSILVDDFENEEQREKMLELHGDIYITDNKYRLAACIDTRTSVYETPGNYTIYHFALEHHDNLMNYGIYANGLLVETCSERNLKELSGMVLIE